MEDEFYICPVWGRNHRGKDICPIVYNRIHNKKYEKRNQNYALGIYYMCIKKDLSFYDLLVEIGYLGYIKDISNPFKQGVTNPVMSPDLFLTYASMFCNCSVSDFVLSSGKSKAFILELLSEKNIKKFTQGMRMKNGY